RARGDRLRLALHLAARLFAAGFGFLDAGGSDRAGGRRVKRDAGALADVEILRSLVVLAHQIRVGARELLPVHRGTRLGGRVPAPGTRPWPVGGGSPAAMTYSTARRVFDWNCPRDPV